MRLHARALASAATRAPSGNALLRGSCAKPVREQHPRHTDAFQSSRVDLLLGDRAARPRTAERILGDHEALAFLGEGQVVAAETAANGRQRISLERVVLTAVLVQREGTVALHDGGEEAARANGGQLLGISDQDRPCPRRRRSFRARPRARAYRPCRPRRRSRRSPAASPRAPRRRAAGEALPTESRSRLAASRPQHRSFSAARTPPSRAPVSWRRCRSSRSCASAWRQRRATHGAAAAPRGGGASSGRLAVAAAAKLARRLRALGGLTRDARARHPPGSWTNMRSPQGRSVIRECKAELRAAGHGKRRLTPRQVRSGSGSYVGRIERGFCRDGTRVLCASLCCRGKTRRSSTTGAGFTGLDRARVEVVLSRR